MFHKKHRPPPAHWEVEEGVRGEIVEIGENSVDAPEGVLQGELLETLVEMELPVVKAPLTLTLNLTLNLNLTLILTLILWSSRIIMPF